jgi:hypothetical protein
MRFRHSQLRPRASFRSDPSGHGAVLLRLPAAVGGAGGNMMSMIRENSSIFSPSSPTVTSSLNRPSVGQQAAQAAAEAAMAAVAQEGAIQVR